MTQRSGRGRLGSWVALLAALSGAALMIDASPRDVQAQGRADVAIVDGAYQPGSILVQAGEHRHLDEHRDHTTPVTADDGCDELRAARPRGQLQPDLSCTRLSSPITARSILE